MRLWVKIKQEGLRRFWSMFPLTRVPFWYRSFEPLPMKSTVWAAVGSHHVSPATKATACRLKKQSCLANKTRGPSRKGPLLNGFEKDLTRNQPLEGRLQLWTNPSHLYVLDLLEVLEEAGMLDPSAICT